MSRIRNQAEFIEKAKLIHGDKYDYSLVDYVKSSQNVIIICPIHGEFQQTPNHHLRGSGCKQCGRVRTRNSVEDFVEKARAVHGNKYDYSKVEYTSVHNKVTIICPIHGEFQQTPHSHVTNKQGCPVCATIQGAAKRSGKNNVAHQESVKAKKRQTCLKRYGAKTWAESDDGRQKLHDIIVSDEVSLKMKNTCRSRYMADNWSQSADGKQSLHKLMSSDDMKQRVVDGYRQKYGTNHYMKTDEGRKKAQQSLSTPEHREALKVGMIKKYGVPYAPMIPNVQKEIVKYSLITKRQNGTFNISKPENSFYLMLCDVFGKSDVIRQYSDDRYPFCCDFYINSLDLFIELNLSWTHGGHWFDSNNISDLEQLSKWQERSLQRGSRYYKQAIETWTVRDVAKKQTAEANGINYLVFWRNDLSDARAWLLDRQESSMTK